MDACTRFAASALLALGLAPAAHAGDELYLRWDNCFGDGGVYNKVFACDTNSGAEVLVGSFRLATTTDSVSGLEVTVDLSTIGATMPLWWSLRSSAPQGCRPTSLAAIFSPPGTSTTCLDMWAGNASGGVNVQAPTGTAYGRILSVVALPSPMSFTAQAGQEIFAFQMRVNNANTVGSSACGGCSTPVCIAWGEARINRPVPLPSVQILGANTPDNGSNVTWQPGAVATTVGICPPNRPCETYVICQSVTPTRGSTWGAIKSLYR